ncbi:hypothetical protein [uncultured Nocardioides sp.]|uniref:hypothetical protein n=1 Tax=uncultured Nocardioides sp. TaxID=198441 RepID=UPI002614A2C0|nr:hypothetical protein [uncultured Nocardioides sp.]
MSRWEGQGPYAELRVWGTASVLPALGRMALGRRHLRDVPGLRFAKLLGTGSGETFRPQDADPGHWALLTVWADEDARSAFAESRLVRAWQGDATEELTVSMTPLTSRGRWSGVEPFAEPVAGPEGTEGGGRWRGPVAAITRARLRTLRTPSFWRAVPAVADDLGSAAGLRVAVGIGESPVGLQGTFSMWESTDALVGFAYRSAAHREVVRRTTPARWYAEEMFARFAVTGTSGTYRGEAP